MSRLRTMPARKAMTLDEAIERVNDAHLAQCLSVFFAELARAQLEGDQEAIHEANRAIAEAMRGVPDGPIDVPLLPQLRKSSKKKRR